MKKFLTVEDLIRFCESQKLYSFNAKDSGATIVVHDNNFGMFELDDDTDGDDIKDSLLHLRINAAHCLKNNNGSHISKENMKKHMQTLKNKPLLAHIIESPNDPSVLDFDHHNMEFTEDGKTIYIERQVGHFTGDEIKLEYDKIGKRHVIIGNAVVPEQYSEAANIIRRKGGTKVSCEIEIYEFAYNSKEKYLDIIDFQFTAVTLLGEHIKCGMEGSRADIVDINEFSAENNSVFSQSINDTNTKLLETLEALNNTLTKFNIKVDENIPSTIKSFKEGGNEVENTKFLELLKQYNKEESDITFSIEGLSDDELENKFAEEFSEPDGENKEENPESTSDGEDDGNTGENSEENPDGKENPEYDEDEKSSENNEDNSNPEQVENSDESKVSDNPESNPEDKSSENPDTFSKSEKEPMVRTYEISHDDIRFALYNLIAMYEEMDNDYFYITAVYDDKFIMESWSGSIYGQKYTVDGDNVALDGERYKLYREYLTESEKAALDEMKSNYSSIADQLSKYQTAELNAQKESILSDSAYAEFIESEEFKDIKSNIDKYSVDELKTACELAFAKCVKKQGSFSLKDKVEKKESDKKKSKIGIFSNPDHEDDPYGDYFKSIRR